MRAEKRIGKGEGEEKIEEKEGQFQFYYLVGYIIHLFFSLLLFLYSPILFPLFIFSNQISHKQNEMRRGKKRTFFEYL